MMSITSARGRKYNWTGEDEVMLVEEVSSNENLLFGKHDGAVRTQNQKLTVWKEIADRLNARNTSVQRGVAEVKKKYQNIKQKAKEKRSGTLYPKTGGGRKMASPTIPEQLVLDNLEGRPSLCGLSGGIDTAVPISTDYDMLPSLSGITLEMPVTDLAFTPSQAYRMTSATATAAPTDTATAAATPTATATATPTATTKKRTEHTSLEEELLLEELARVKDARNLIKEQVKLAKIQKHLAILKIKEIDPSFEE